MNTEIPDGEPRVAEYAQDSVDGEREYFAILRERHERIKQERRSILTTLIGLSGGAIVLSASLLEKIAALKVALWLLVSSWSLFGMSVIAALLGLAAMTRQSMRYQRLLEQRLVNPRRTSDRLLFWRSSVKWREESSDFLAPSKRASGLFVELAAGVLFVAGAILLGVFAILNLSAS
jgi:hypothetical protein